MIYQGQAPALQVGNRVFTDLTNLIQLSGVSNGAAGGLSSLRVPAATAGRAVTSGKSLVITAVRVNITTAGLIYFGYSDNDVGLATNTAATNPKYFLFASAGSEVVGAANVMVEKSVLWTIPAGKFVLGNVAGSTFVGTYEVFGYES